MRLFEELTSSFRGGMNDSAPATGYAEDEAALALNARISPEGAAVVRYGSRRTHAAALAAAQCWGATRFRTGSGTTQYVVFVGDKMFYSTDLLNWTQGASALRTDYWSFTTYRQGTTTYLVCANGGTSTYKWDGTTWAAVANIPAGVKYVATFNERLYAAGHDGVTVRASAVRNMEVWTIPFSLSLQVAVHDGDAEITGLCQIGSILLAFKRHSTAAISGYGNMDIVVASGPQGVSRSVGCLGHRTVVPVGDDGVAWLSERGIEFYQGGRATLVSEKIRGFFSGLAWNNIAADAGVACAAYWPRRHEYRLALPGSGSSQNNYEVLWNTVTGALSVVQYTGSSGGTLYVDADGYLAFSAAADRQVARTESGYLTLATGSEPGLYVELDASDYLVLTTTDHANAAFFPATHDEDPAHPHGVGYDGFVRCLECGDRDNEASDTTGGDAIGGKLRTRPFYFGSPSRRKRGRIVRLSAASDAAATVTLAVLADGVEQTAHAVTVPASSGGQPKRVKARTSARGDSLQVEVRTSKAGLQIPLVSLEAEVLREVGR